MPQVQIIRRERAEITGPEGRPLDVTQVTYSTATLPPAVVTVEKTDPTDDEVAAAIRADIDARATVAGETLDV